ncbi:hypothetical protein FRC07_014687 [Ceratobasidium sp. 392]|nr:hypothetical protein FRC07_014687 [Ceratobasidium sp. 392]
MLNLFRNLTKGSSTPSMLKDWNQKDPEEKLVKARILHDVLQNMDWLNNRNLNEILPCLGNWGTYNTILSKIAGSSEPSKLADARRLFAFKPSSSELYTSSRYIVADESLIAQCAPKYPVKLQRNSRQELLIPVQWVDKILKDQLRGYLNNRLRRIYSGLIRSGWTSLCHFKPSLRLTSAINRPVSRAMTSDDKFKTRLNVATNAIQAFAPVCHIPLEINSSRTDPSLIQLWVRRLFEIVYPITGTFEEIMPARVRQGQPSYPGVQSCIQQYLLNTSWADLSMFIIANSIATQLRQLPHSDTGPLSLAVSGGLPDSQLLEKNMIEAFFNREEAHGLTVVNFGLRCVESSIMGEI